MKLRQLALCLIVPLVTGLSQQCLANPIIYTAVLSGASEVPPNNSPGTGLATLSLNGDSLGVTISFSNLVAPATASHIHCCAPPGVTAPVEVPFTPFPNTTSGVYTSTINLAAVNYTAGFTEANLLAGLNSGLAYVNIHDTTFPGGEIRGQVIAATPEPGSLVLLGTGLLGLWKVRRTHAL